MPVRQYTLFTIYPVRILKTQFIVDGEGAARYIKSTNSKNTNTPIVAVSAYSSTDPNETSNVFAAALAKPLQKADLIGKFRLSSLF
jgi:hypothetical protein